MFSELIIDGMQDLINYFQKLDLPFYFTKPQIKHMQAFIVAMMLSGFDGKMTQISGLALHADRSCVCRFLDSDSWDDAFLLRAINEYVITEIWEHSKRTGLPIYAILDDTICEKTKPSSKAKQPIYGCGFHRSHLKNEIVYGHQFVAAVLRCGDMVLPLAIHLYEKEKTSKIDIAVKIIEALPKPVNQGYVMADSWYSCIDLFHATESAGYHYIGALKSNRKIFPRGYRRKGIQIGAFARSLTASDFDIVTIDGERYYMYTYLGKINGSRKVKIVITYPHGALFVPRAMKAFISTDIKMSGKQLLNHYTKRWPIEVFFRESNRQFGMKKCQVRSKKAIMRYQYLVMLAFIFCGVDVNDKEANFSLRRKMYQNDIQRFHIAWIVKEARNDVPIEDIFAVFKLAA